MKKLMSILGGLLVATAAQAVDAYLDLASLNCNPATNRIVEHQRLQPFPGNTVSNWSGSGGFVVISNVGVGDYNVWVKQRGQAGPIAFSFSITTNDSGTVFVHTNNLSVINVGTYPKTGQAAWSIAAAESRYARKGEAGGAAVTGAELVETSTNGTLVTTLVRTQAVQQLTVAGSTNAQNAANATNLYPSGPLSVNFNSGTLTSGNSTMNASGFTVNNGGSLTPAGFNGGGLNLTNVSGLATGATNATGKTIATTEDNITGTASGLDATGLGVIDTRRKNSLEAGTNVLHAQRSVLYNATFGTLGLQTNNSSIASVDGYDGGVRLRSATGKPYQILRAGGGPLYDVTGAQSYYGATLDDPSFNALQVWTYGEAVSAAQNLRDTDVNVSSSLPFVGGSGAALQDIPMSSTAIGAHLPSGPPIIITTWNNSNESHWVNQTNCWDQLRNASTNGLLTALTNLGYHLWYHLDTNARWITNTRVGGELSINYAEFPNSTNFLAYWQSNGFKFTLTAYTNKRITNQYTINMDTGFEVAPGVADSFPVMTPNTVASDVRTFYRWGIDQMRGSDVSPGVGYHHFWPRIISSLCLNPLGSSWASWYVGDYAQLGRTNRPMSFQWLTPHIGRTDPEVYMHANLVLHDWSGNYPGYVNTGDAFLNWMNVFRALATNVVPHLSVGHYGAGPTFFSDLSVNQTRLELSAAAMTWGAVQISTPTNQMLSAFIPTAVTNMTNSAWLRIHQDVTGLQNGSKLIRLSDSGATNTSAWAKQLSGGQYAVLLVNESGTAQNITFTAGQLGAPISRSFSAYDVWNGTNTGFFSTSHSVVVASKDSCLLHLRPVKAQTIGYISVSTADIGRLTGSSLSPAPSYWEDGFTLASGSTGGSRLSKIDNETTNVTVVTKIQANAITAWSNTIYGFYYSPAGRVICAQSNNVPCLIGAANSTSNWTFSVAFPATNAPKVVGINLTTSTNSGTRYLGPNLTIYQE